MAERDVDVVVVGAGLAGLAAARRVVARGATVQVLEARDRVGGRTLNEDIGGGNVVEVGGQWFGPTQHRILELIDELDLKTFPTYDHGENLIEHGGRLRRYTGPIPRINPVVLADVGQAQARLDRMARKIDPEQPWAAPNAQDLDRETLYSWTRRNMATDTGRELISLLCEAVYAVHSADLSLLHFLFYVASAGGIDDLVGTSGGAQEMRLVGGSQRIALTMAEQLTDDRIVLDAPVRRITQDAHGVTVHADGGQVVRAGRVVLALPPVLTARIDFDPAMPGLRDQLTQRMPQGSVIKCMAVYPDPFWRRRGLTGQATSTAGPVKLTFDNSPPGGSPGVLLGFLEGDQARILGAWPAHERREAVIDCFCRYFGANAARPDTYVERSWADEPYSRGCYGAVMTPNTWTVFGKALRTPIGRVHWAGAETATRWSGYMDGAVSSGERAADEALAAA